VTVNEQKNAPAGQGEGDDQNTQGRGTIMHIISDPGHKYHGWTVRVGEDWPCSPEVAEDLLGRGLMRIHCRASRTPSKREFVIRSFSGATEEDRAKQLKLMSRIHRTFEQAEATPGIVQRVLNRAGRYWIYVIWPGSPIEDPLIQLELEMMIDLHSEVSA
jgi:hypothetical protein